jgi:hypothetical protein
MTEPDRPDYSIARLPSAALPAVIGSFFLAVGALAAFGWGPAAFVALAALMGWASGVLHERYTGR